MDVYRDEGIFEHCAAVAPVWEDMLHSLSDLPMVVDIRNYGLVGAVQLEQQGAVGAAGRAAFERLWDFGLTVRPIGDSLAMSPPLVLTEAHIAEIGDLLRRGIPG